MVVYLTESCRDDNHTTVRDLRTRAGGRRSRSTNVSVSQSDRFGSDSHNLKVTTSYLFSPDKDLFNYCLHSLEYSYRLAWIVIHYIHVLVLYAYRLTQKIHKKFGHISDMSGEFPNRPGSHLSMQNPALEFIKCVCKVGDCSAQINQKHFLRISSILPPVIRISSASSSMLSPIMMQRLLCFIVHRYVVFQKKCFLCSF